MTEKIGKRIRQIRESKNLSAIDLSEKSAIQPSQLERIEQGELIPSLSTLIRIARALETRLGTILDGEESTAPALHLNKHDTPTISLSSGQEQAREHLHFFALAHQKSDRNMDPFLIDVEYSDPGLNERSHHEGEEFIYVLTGNMDLRYGSECYHLDPGDSIYFDSIVPHCLSSREPGAKAQVLAVTYAPF